MPDRNPTRMIIFLAPILNFSTISLLVLFKYEDLKKFFDWAIIGGDTIVPLSLRLRGIKLRLVSDKAESNLFSTYTIGFCLV